MWGDGAALLLPLVGWIAYFVIGHGLPAGQTLGKKALRIAVRRESDGGPVGYGRSLGRFLAQAALGWSPLINILNLLAPLWSKKNQCWHDQLAHTVVVRT